MAVDTVKIVLLMMGVCAARNVWRVDLQRNKTSLHIVTSVGYSIDYYDVWNNKYKIHLQV